MISKFILDLPHRPVWLLVNQDFTETDIYYNWCKKLHRLNVERREAARLIERAHSVYQRLITK
jgi:hypothetical protein